MKRFLILIFAAVLFTACTNSQSQLRTRAAELCQYIPDHELSAQSKDYMTTDFFAVLDTMFNRLPEFEAMDHEWLHYFVTGNGGTIADYEVKGVELTDKTHAIATIQVRQKWEDGSFDESSDVEEHKLYMEKVDGKWLMSDFDGHKQDCIRHIAISRKEQARRDAISDYLVKEIGQHYLQGEICIPQLMIVRTDEQEKQATVWGDFWVLWYQQAGDTLKTVSGGNHAGRMTLSDEGNGYKVISFEQVEDGSRFLPSAQRIFGEYFDVFQNMNSNQEVREAVRKEQLREYVHHHGLDAKYYQDYGWPAVAID